MFRNLPQGFLILLVLTVIVNMGMGIVIPVLPSLVQETTHNVASLGIPFFTLVLFRLVSRPMAGYVIGKIGTQRVLNIMYTLFGLSFCLYTFADSLTMFSIIRGFEGIAEGIASVVLLETALALIKGRKDSGRLMGLFSSSFGLGFILGPALGSLLFMLFDKDAMFYFGLTASIIGVVLVRYLPIIDKKIFTDKKKKIGFVNFIFYSNRYFSSYIPQVLRRVIFFSLMIVIPIYAVNVLHIDAKHVGWIFTLSACITTVLMPMFGSLSDKFNPTKIVFINLMIMAISFLFIGLYDSTVNFVVMIIIETLAFSAMLPAGMKVFAIHMESEQLRPEIMGLFGSYVEIITLFIALLLPAIFSVSSSFAWETLAAICVISAYMFYLNKPKLAIIPVNNNME